MSPKKPSTKSPHAKQSATTPQSKRTTASVPVESQPAFDIPDWAKETPEEYSYGMEMSEPYRGAVETVEMTRAEYIALKQHLAVMRGYVQEKNDAS